MRDLPVRQGENHWLLLRTDRDGASDAEVRKSAAVAVADFLKPANSYWNSQGYDAPWEAFELNGEWRMGLARPVRVVAVGKLADAMPEGETLGKRTTADPNVVPTVKAQSPWFVHVVFWWRGPDSTVPYPALRVNWMGRRVKGETVDNDWLLEEAIFPTAPAIDPGNQTWGEQAGEAVKGAAVKMVAGAGVLVGLALAAGLVYVLAKGNR